MNSRRDKRRDRERGVVLALILIIALLLSASIITFVRRSVVDGMVIRNRENVAEATALAHGGIQIAIAILVQDRYGKAIQAASGGSPGTTLADVWAQVRDMPLKTGAGAKMRLIIEDAGSRLNVNSLVPIAKEGAEGQAPEETQEFLVAFIEKVLDEMEQKAENRTYDAREMARNLIDYIDGDDVAIGGRGEDDYYLAQNPPYVAANRPMLSVEEIAMVEGFDAQMAEAMAPYLTVHPLLGETGINLNTAPPHVLALIYHGSSGDKRLANEDTVRQILSKREDDYAICAKAGGKSAQQCVGLSEVGLGEGSIFPPTVLPMNSRTFLVTAEARVDDVARTVEAVIDINDRELPLLLSLRTH